MFSLLTSLLPARAAIPIAGTLCPKLGQQQITSGYKYTCVRSGKKLVWSNGVKVSTPSPQPSQTPSSLAEYLRVKLLAYKNIREAMSVGNLNNVNLVYHISSFFPSDLKKLYMKQVEEASNLYGTFFTKKETMNIYMYTEKDIDYLKSEVLFSHNIAEFQTWFDAWKKGQDREHNLGLVAGYFEYPNLGDWVGQAGVLVFSGANTSSLRKYAIQVMPHEYFHVVQDYYLQGQGVVKFTDEASKERLSPLTFREGSANTISFAVASDNATAYLDLYKDFIDSKKVPGAESIFKTLTNTKNIIAALNKIETKMAFPEAQEDSYSIGSLLYEWVIAEYGFDAYRKLIENQNIGSTFEENVIASLGITKDELYAKAAPHILAAFTNS